MIAVSVKSLWAHKRRLIGMCLAVVLGVAFLSGTLALNDTLKANFNRLFSDAGAGTDVVVRSNAKLGRGDRALIPASLIASVRAVPGVADAQPVIDGYGQLLGSNGSPLGGSAPRDASNWIADPALNAYRLVQGRGPEADDEVVINRGAAKKGHLRIGQSTIVQTPQPQRVTVVGIATFGGADGFGQTTFTGFTLHAAQERLAGGAGQVSSISVKAAPGVTQDELAARVAPRLPPGVEAITGAQSVSGSLSDTAGPFLSFLRTFMTMFAAIAMAVAIFSIYNTFSILTAQRTRETALLRTLGASRRQALASVGIEALAVGTAASVVGLAGGIGIAGLLKGLFNSVGFGVPAGGLVFRGTTVLVALTAGIVATLLAALLPARRASRTPPLAALRDVPTQRAGRSPARAVAGVALVAAGAAIVLTSVSATGGGALARAGLGAVVMIAGVVVLGPVVSRAAVAVLGAPSAVTRGVTGALARENARRNPRRTAATAAALMVGVTVVTLFTVFAASLKTSITREVTRSVRADLVVSAGASYGGARMSPQLVSDLVRLPEVRAATGLTTGNARIAGSNKQVVVVDPSRFSGLVDIGVVHGSVAGLSDRQLAVSTKTATDKAWKVGSAVPVTFPDGTTTPMTVGAIYRDRGIAGDFVVPESIWTAHSAQPLDSTVFVALRPGASPRTGQAAVQVAARQYGNPKVQTPQGYAATIGSMVNSFLGLVYALLALSVVIALLGISNTLSLSTHERTRELGLLRAVGQTRSQLRSMVRDESTIVALFGTIGGVGLGAFLGWALVQAANSAYVGTTFTAPVSQLVLVLVVGAVAGVLAGIRPARRAARIDVLAAIATE